MIIINKVDLDEDLQADKLKKYKNTGFTILALSKITQSYDELHTELSVTQLPLPVNQGGKIYNSKCSIG